MSSSPLNFSSPIGGPEFKPNKTPESERNQTTPSVPSAQDTLAKASEVENPQNKAAAETPSLPTPKTTHVSLMDFLSAIGDARLNFYQTLQKSEQANIGENSKSQTLMYQMEVIDELEDSLEEAIQEVEVKRAEVVAILEAAFDQVEELVAKQNEMLAILEAGNAEEQAQFAAYSKAYTQFKEEIAKFNLIVENESGEYVLTLPSDPETQQACMDFAETYNQAVRTFNAYLSERLAQVDAYNNAANAYNAKVSEINQILNQLNEEYDLSIPVNPIPLAELKDTSIYTPLSEVTFYESTDGTIHMHIPVPSAMIEDVAKNGPSVLQPLSFEAPDAAQFENVITEILYNRIVVPIEEQLDQEIYLLSMMSQQIPDSVIEDPILNRKPLSELLFPSSYIHYEKSEIATQTELLLERLRKQTEAEKEFVKKMTKEMISSSVPEIIEKKLELLHDKLALLFIDQLNRHSLNAVIQGIPRLGTALSLLPKDSPALFAVFNLSFVKNVLLATRNGQTEQEFQHLIRNLPDMESLLNSAQKDAITHAMSTAQLRLANKFLESSIGISNKTSDLLPLTDQLKNFFLEKNYSEDQANFLAKVGSSGIKEGFFLSAAPSTITYSNIQLPILLDSLTAAILLLQKDFSLSQAAALAEKAVAHTLSQSPFKSTERFRSLLEQELKGLGLKEQAKRIAQLCILIPKGELTPNKLESSLTSLFSPHLDKKIAEDLSKDIVHTLDRLNQEIDSQSGSLPKRLAANFTSQLNNSLELYNFLSTLTNPAALFIHSIPKETIQFNKDLSI